MVLKKAPEVHFAGGILRKEIGTPEDYTKNVEHKFFPEHLDLRIKPEDNATQSETEIQGHDIENLLTEQLSRFNLQDDCTEAPTEISSVMQYLHK